MLTLLKNGLQPALKTIIGRATTNKGEFEKRIQHRHRTFWSSPEAELIRNTPMGADDPIQKWKNVEYWQRKLSNKYNAREFARMHGCRVPDLYWRGRHIAQLDLGSLPAQYVIRPTIGHSSERVFLMDDGLNLMDKRRYSHQEIKEALAKAVAQEPFLEFLVEEFVRDEKGVHRIPDDYKISVFNGEIAVIDVINRTSPKSGYSSCYDEKWNKLENLSGFYQQAPSQEPPKCLPEMLTYARNLSRTYEIFVRADFYATDKGAVFGEFTPTPSLGKGFTPKAEQLLTGYWDRYCKGSI